MHWRPQSLALPSSCWLRGHPQVSNSSAGIHYHATRTFATSQPYHAAETSAAGATNGANPYPFPSKDRPTPHDIFHLPKSASKKDIKQRYFELARIYHPDSAISRPHPTDVIQARWNAISAAYDHLRGKRAAHQPWPSSSAYSSYPRSGSSSASSSGSSAGGAYAGRRTPWGGFDPDGNPRPHPDGLTEPFWMSQRTLMASVVIAVSASILFARAFVTSPSTAAAQHHLDAAYNLEQARRRGKEQGELRRQELRAWIEEGGMQGMGAQIGKGRTRTKPPDDALDAQRVENAVQDLPESR
ncbi:hypothetical protein DL93DRAFT_1927280 [Clavulina sp. PMI_390]|nr:hypothetical protein DL93DRAFT_1927280 [Clavulina sp. PMI_390]